MKKPKQLKGLHDEQGLRDLCQQYIDYLTSDEYHEDSDYDHYIFEKALEAVFGINVWDYVNNINE